MKLKHIAAPLVLAALAQTASAAVVYSNNFDGESLGGVSGATNPFNHGGGTGSYTDVVAASTVPNFTTQHLELASRNDNYNYAFGNFNGSLLAADPGFASVTTFKFDAYFNSADFAATSQLRMRARDTAFSGGGTDTVRKDLNVADVTTGVVINYEYVINNSTASADAPSVGGTIASGTWALYANGVLDDSGSNFTAADDLAVDTLTLWIKGDSGTTQQGIVRIDNFEVHTNAVPEPSSTALLGLGALALIMRKRR